MFEFQEASLRDLIRSPYAVHGVDALMDRLHEKGRVQVGMENGSITTLTQRGDAHALLARWGWQPINEPTPVVLEEATVRALMESAHGQECLRAMIQAVKDGARAQIRMNDGTLHDVTTAHAFAKVLREHFRPMP